MSFINRYSDHIYHYNKEFTENGKTFILAIGRRKGNAAETFVSKIDLDGNEIWQKTFFIEPANEIVYLRKIIQIQPPNFSGLPKNNKALGIQYVIYAEGEFDNYLFSINSTNGNVGWIKKINYPEEDISIFIEPRVEFSAQSVYAFYLAISNNNNVDGKSNPLIAKFDANGELVSAKHIVLNKVNFKIKDFHAHEKGVGMACEYTEKGTKGIVIDFSSELVVNASFIINILYEIQNLKITPERIYYISGYHLKNKKVFVCKVPPEDGGSFNIKLILFPNTIAHNSKLQLSNGGAYLLHNSQTHGIVNLLDSNLNLQWSKELRFNGNENGMNDFTVNKKTNNITSFAFNKAIQISLVHTDRLLTTCKTEVLDNTLNIINSTTTVVGIAKKIAKLTLTDHQITTELRTSTKIEYCNNNGNQPCEAHIAFLIDESGSINGNEIVQIKSGLQAFVDQQLGTTLKLSFIGMSAQDNDTRNDHILEQNVTSLTKPNFDQWITEYRNRGVNGGADYWASGFDALSNLTSTPDVVFVITDGLQVNNPTTLFDLTRLTSNQSHIFYYGIALGYYHNGTGASSNMPIIESLNFYLNRAPIESTTNNDLLITDYKQIDDFTSLGTALSDLSQTIIDSEVGCGNVKIIENNTLVEPLPIGQPLINVNIGTLRLRNEKMSAHTIIAGSQIANINGLLFTVANEVTIAANGVEALINIVLNGTPTNSGNFTQEIALTGVLNPNQFSIVFNVLRNIIEITEITSFQSPNFYLQSVGSTGQESTKGIHTRWMFRGAIGDKHLPKGDNATNNGINFNKQNDYVKVYRAKYIKQVFLLDLYNNPTLIDNNNRLWIYRFNQREFFVYFRDANKYDQIIAGGIDPLINTQEFILSYGNKLIEIENRTELFFAVKVNIANVNSSSSLRIESLSVSENTLLSPKIVSSRKTYQSAQLNSVRLICENGRSIRYIPNNCTPNKFEFEFYSDFVAEANKRNYWVSIGDFALSLNNEQVKLALEPIPNTVNGKWNRYNEDAYVNVDNYTNKWNGTPEDQDRNIKQVVQNYITLSDSVDNPTAIESIALEDQEGETLDISNLDLLNIASYDFHIARMLGLGVLDIDTQIFDNSYIYIAEYTTFGDLEDGLGAREVQHLSMSLPTALTDQRLPLPIDLKRIVPGAFIGNEGEPSSITDDEGYTQDKKLRFVTLFAEEIPEDPFYPPFFDQLNEFSADTFTQPIFAGLEYRKVPTGSVDSNEWEKPEISNDFRYLNVDSNGNEIPHYFETRVIEIPEINLPFYVHKHRIGGNHFYQSYGINWFSRATMSTEELQIETVFTFNPLLPPTNINSLLIREESPLMLSSADEQVRLGNISNNVGVDRTLIRIIFDYHSYQDLINYKVPLDSPLLNSEIIDSANANNPNVLFPDDQEVFADDVAIYFRNQTPNNISGKIVNVIQDPNQNILSTIITDEYFLASQDPNINEPNASPIVISGTESNYVGGTLLIGQQQYIIYELTTGANGFAEFRVYNKEISDGIITNSIPSVDAENLQIPEITDDGFFMAVENMQNDTSWGNPNPLAPFKVKIDENWAIHREVLGILDDDGNIERQVEKTRGIWSDAALGAIVEEFPVPIGQEDDGTIIQGHNGTYKITFNNIQLAHHEQNTQNYSEINSVEWYKGIVRVFAQQSVTGTLPNRSRKNLKVIRIENIGESTDLIVYAYDTTYSDNVDYDSIQIGNNISVNFYPGYKAYLYKDDVYGLNENNILPNEDEDVKYSIFGLQSVKNYITPLQDKKSKISVPSLMFAQKMIEAERPEQPEGALYATRPDFFGRSTYTIKTKYIHKPHGVLFYRSNDQALLNALYSKSTILQIREALKNLGGNEEAYFNNRWENFLNFTELSTDGDFKEYPPEGVGEEHYRFPNPDKLAFFEWANVLITRINDNSAFPPDSQIPLFNVVVDDQNDDAILNPITSVGDPSLINFVKGAIFNAFVPLTQIPIIYQHIEPSSYKPINKKQVVRDRNGHVLHPSHDDFEMAPMMKITSVAPHETQFVDFNLDGTSNNIYFYGVRELSSQMKMGEFSPFIGPIKLVNTNPPESPEIKRIMPILENPILDIVPSIQLEINAYPEVQNVKKVNVYRAFNKLDSLSIRTMKLVKTIDIEDVGIVSEAIWSVQDDFSDLDEIPYNEGLFYRITVAKKVEYAKANYTPDVDGTIEIITDYAPSQASKIVATMMVEINNPPAPLPIYISEPINDQGELHQSMLRWNKTCYKGKYHVYKMNSQGNWVKIHELTSNEETIYLELVNTSLENHILQTKNEEGKDIYHHFKVTAENTSGMLSTEENIVTTYNQDTWNDIGGIDDMIIGPTFLIR